MGADREADVTRLAEALNEHFGYCEEFDVKESDVNADCPDCLTAWRAAAALLPVVDDIARQRAAEELEAAADWLWDETGAGTYAHNHLKDRAAALRGPHA